MIKIAVTTVFVVAIFSGAIYGIVKYRDHLNWITWKNSQEQVINSRLTENINKIYIDDIEFINTDFKYKIREDLSGYLDIMRELQKKNPTAVFFPGYVIRIKAHTGPNRTANTLHVGGGAYSQDDSCSRYRCRSYPSLSKFEENLCKERSCPLGELPLKHFYYREISPNGQIEIVSGVIRNYEDDMGNTLYCRDDDRPLYYYDDGRKAKCKDGKVVSRIDNESIDSPYLATVDPNYIPNKTVELGIGVDEKGKMKAQDRIVIDFQNKLWKIIDEWYPD